MRQGRQVPQCLIDRFQLSWLRGFCNCSSKYSLQNGTNILTRQFNLRCQILSFQTRRQNCPTIHILPQYALSSALHNLSRASIELEEVRRILQEKETVRTQKNVYNAVMQKNMVWFDTKLGAKGSLVVQPLRPLLTTMAFHRLHLGLLASWPSLPGQFAQQQPPFPVEIRPFCRD